ncbi:MAG: hypothetical protein Q8Q50_02720 [Methylobacter sp.]|nr:hypothetical protein [Methylobacter sp.]
MNKLILRPVKTEQLTAVQFLRVSGKSHNIEKSRFIPPKLGDNDFGRFEVTYRNGRP